MKTIKDYIAIAMQLRCKAVNKCSNSDEARTMMDATVSTLAKEIAGAKRFIGSSTRLIVLPEYFLTSYPTRESIAEWREKAAISKDDPIFNDLGQICKDLDVFLSGNYYEQDPNFPKFYFQSSFILDNHGKMILNYRRLNSMYSVTPHDVMEQYIELYGYESLFPVVDTELGKLACVASEEILYPEVTRCLMMRGAEVILHSSSEIGSSTLSKKNIAKRARALENVCYVISANSAGIEGGLVLAESTDGHSQIVDYHGAVQAEALTGESIVANGYISISSMRQYRNTVGMKNYIARQRFELYAHSYSDHSFYPPNTFVDSEMEKSKFITNQVKTISKLKDSGVIED